MLASGSRAATALELDALVDRSGIDPSAVDDVVFGCVDTIGPQAGDIARTCWLVAGVSTPCSWAARSPT